MKKVLIVIDMQNDFLTGTLGSEAAQAAIEPVRQRLAAQRTCGGRVIFTADTHNAHEFEKSTSQEGKKIPAHCIKGTPGWQIAKELSPLDDEIVVEKPSFGALNLAEVIGPLEEGDVIELCGVCTDICVISNALHLRACYPANRIAVIKAGCAGTSEENHQAALAVMASCLINAE